VFLPFVTSCGELAGFAPIVPEWHILPRGVAPRVNRLRHRRGGAGADMAVRVVSSSPSTSPGILVHLALDANLHETGRAPSAHFRTHVL